MAEVVKAIFKAAVEGPDVLLGIYACHEKAISSLILESSPVWMTVTDWAQPRSRSNYQLGGYLDGKQEVGYSESW